MNLKIRSYPEVTDGMAQYCQAEWEELMASKRCFRMPVFLICDPRYTGIERVLGCSGANEIVGDVVSMDFVLQNNTGSSVDLAGFNFDGYRSGAATVGADWIVETMGVDITLE